MREYNPMSVTSTDRNKLTTGKLFNQDYGYYKAPKTFSKFYYRQLELIVEYNVGFKLFCIWAYQRQYFMVI